MSTRPEGAIAVNPAVARFLETRRQVVDVASTDFTDVSAVVLSSANLHNGLVTRLAASGFGMPVFVVAGPDEEVDLSAHRIAGMLWRAAGTRRMSRDLDGREIDLTVESLEGELDGLGHAARARLA